MTPGGRDESLVPERQLLGRGAGIEEQIGLLTASLQSPTAHVSNFPLFTPSTKVQSIN
jgi:hypothetical protein